MATSLVLSSAQGAAVAADSGPLITRPVAETFGTHPGYGSAGSGVNTGTGNYTIATTDLALPGGVLTWSRTYNSLDRTDSPLGRGWTSSFSARLEPGDGNVRLHDDQGRVLTFTARDGGGYSRPADLDATLTAQPGGGYRLAFRTGEEWTFDADGTLGTVSGEGVRATVRHDAAGRLTGLADNSGHTLALSYDGDLLDTVTSGDGRTVRYSHTGTALTAAARPDGTVRYQVDDDGRITAGTDVHGRTVRTEYDPAGRVSRQTLADGSTVSFGYDEQAGSTTVGAGGANVTYQHDAQARLVKAAGPGVSVSQSYDAQGRLTGVTAPGRTVAVEYDARGNVAGVTRDGVATSYSYDDADRAVAATGPAGRTSYGYTGSSRIPTSVTTPDGATTHNTVTDGLVTSIQDPTGAVTSYTYGDARQLTAAKDANGHTTRYGYDDAGRQTTVTSPLGATSTSDYDPAGRLTSVTDPGGSTTRYTYSDNGFLSAQVDPTGATTKYEYDAAGRRTASTDPIGRTTTYGYDALGEVATVTSPDGGVTHYTYDEQGRVLTGTDRSGAVTRYTYDEQGRQTSRVLQSGTVKTEYDAHGNVVATTDALGRVTRYAYDSQNRQTEVHDPVSGVWYTRYDAAGNVAQTQNPSGAVTKYSYDDAHRKLSMTDPLGRVTRFRYDGVGNLLAVVAPSGATTTYGYDADNVKTSVTSPTGLVTKYSYDTAARTKSTTDPRGKTTTQQFSRRGEAITVTSPGGAKRVLDYDPAGQLTKVTDGNGHTTAYGYDDGGNLTSLTDGNGHTTKYTYDQAGRQTSSTDPLGRTTLQSYDSTGNLTSVTDPAGKKVTLTYDAVGNLLKRTGADGKEVRFGYDGADRRTTMVDARGTTRYEFDPAGHLLATVQPDGQAWTNTFDLSGRLIRRQYPDGLQQGYRYNDDGRLVGIDDSRAGRVDYALDADGRLQSETLPGGWSRSYRYDGGLPVGYTEKRGSSGTTAATLTRNDDGRLIRQAVNDAVTDYRYDAAGQLLAADAPGTAADLTSAYDGAGNRTSLVRGAVATSLRYDAADQLVSSQTGGAETSYAYDSAGRLTSASSPTSSVAIAYDSLGLPTSRTDRTGTASTTRRFGYDGDGLLTSVNTSGAAGTSAVGYVWSAGGGTPQILRQTGANTADFSYGYGRVFADTSGSGVPFSHDAFGSPVRTTATAPWVQASDYDTFGQPTSAAAGAVPTFGYRGELAVGSQLYLRARNYDPGVGRFTSRDPLSAWVGRSDTTSPYAYANNDPANLVDPLGQSALSDLIAAVLQVVNTLASLQPVALAGSCPDPGNSITRHVKCFQNVPMLTRGFLSEDCLNADEDCLNDYWNSGRKEAAGQSVAIDELNKQREDWWDRYWDDQGGMGTTISQDVDWEVGPQNSYYNFRVDIVVDERQIYEVKRYQGPSTTTDVETQLRDYISELHWQFGINTEAGTQLRDWANRFRVYENFWDYIDPEWVYVWGMGNPDGHVYVAKEDKVSRRVKQKAEEKYLQNQGELFPWLTPDIPFVPIPIEPIPIV